MGLDGRQWMLHGLDDKQHTKKLYIDRLPSYVPVHVAALYCGNKMISVASNAFIHHAEVNCMNNVKHYAIKRYKPLRLVVTRISGIHQMSRPCCDCCKMLKKRAPGVRIFYTNEIGQLCEECDLDNPHESLSKRNCLRCQKK